MGFLFHQDSAKKDSSGNLRTIYLKDEIAGFAVHLIKKN
jgi:2-dehydro-3-deoxyphosphogluconate aldolase/(4S)-4-hydroxy-2-oxoglutarate aldolase